MNDSDVAKMKKIVYDGLCADARTEVNRAREHLSNATATLNFIVDHRGKVIGDDV